MLSQSLISSGGAGLWNINSGRFAGSGEIPTVGGNVWTMHISPDGTNLYFNANGTATQNRMYQYSLSTPWDISTLSFVRLADFATSRATVPIGIHFTSDGTNLFYYGSSTVSADNKVDHFSLSTPWDISTASFVRSLSLASDGANNSRAVTFSPDGMYMFTINLESTGKIFRRALSSAFNISTVSGVTSADITSIFGLNNVPFAVFRPDGKSAFWVSPATDSIYETTMSTPWDITTLSLAKTRSLLAFDSVVRGVFFKPDGSRFYITGAATPVDFQQFQTG